MVLLRETIFIDIKFFDYQLNYFLDESPDNVSRRIRKYSGTRRVYRSRRVPGKIQNSEEFYRETRRRRGIETKTLLIATSLPTHP